MPRTQRSRSSGDSGGDRLDTCWERPEGFVEQPDGLITASRRRDEALRVDAGRDDAIVSARPLKDRQRTLVQCVA